MQVVKVEHKGLLMASGSGQAGVQNYTVEDSQDW